MAKKLYDKDTMELDAIEMEGRTVKLGVEDIYEQLKEVTDTMRAALIAGEEPLNIVFNEPGRVHVFIEFYADVDVGNPGIRKDLAEALQRNIAVGFKDPPGAVVQNPLLAGGLPQVL